MFHRNVVIMAVASALATTGLAMADDAAAPKLTLNPRVITADEAAPPAPLMGALDKIGAAKPLSDLGINIYGWVESGYTYNHRHASGSENATQIFPGPFNHEYGNHYMLNQVDLRIEKQVDPSKGKFDVGGMVELMYGSDAARIHSTGMGFNGSDSTDSNDPSDGLAVANLDPKWQFDIPQAYVDIAVPVGNGLKLRIGKFVTFLSNETIDPRGNAFYSHSYIFNAVNFTNTGIVGFYKLNDQWTIATGVSRGWDVSLEPKESSSGRERCTLDSIGQIVYTPNNQWTVTFNWSTGPENAGDTSHWRTALDPIVGWKVTDKLTLTAEAIYIYDGGVNAPGSGVSHGYGDVWGGALYAGYTLNDYVTLNARAEKVHAYLGSPLGFATFSDGDPVTFSPVGISLYEITLGATVKPFPKDPLGMNLSIRPEVRYDFTDSSVNKPFQAEGRSFKDQLTFGADVIFTF